MEIRVIKTVLFPPAIGQAWAQAGQGSSQTSASHLSTSKSGLAWWIGGTGWGCSDIQRATVGGTVWTWCRGCPGHYRVTYKLWEAADHLPSLQVGLSIQVGSLNVAQAIRVTGGQQQNVRRDDLIAAKTHKISHTDFFPESVHILLFLPDKETVINKTGRRLIMPKSVWWSTFNNYFY